MALPVIPLAVDSAVIGGQSVEIHSLSRKDVLKLKDFQDNLDGGEDYIVARGTGCTEAEAKAWLESTDAMEAGKLIDAIIRLSGLPVTEATSDPKA